MQKISRGRRLINIFATLVKNGDAGAVNGHFRVAQIRLGGLTAEVAVNCPAPLVLQTTAWSL